MWSSISADSPTTDAAPLKGEREVFFHETGFAPCSVYDRYALKAGFELSGPAVIEERESTTVIGPGAAATVDQYLNLIVTLGEQG